jgi:hypothetical protein
MPLSLLGMFHGRQDLSDRHRVEYLFALYEQLTAPLVAAAKPTRKGRRMQAVP